jgi:hypothetical protein
MPPKGLTPFFRSDRLPGAASDVKRGISKNLAEGIFSQDSAIAVPRLPYIHKTIRSERDEKIIALRRENFLRDLSYSSVALLVVDYGLHAM